MDDLTDEQIERQAVADCKALGLSREETATQTGIPTRQVRSLLRQEETQALIAEKRDTIKREYVENAIDFQRQWAEGIRQMPVDRQHALAHRALIEAISKLYDKTAHAAGEATERIETKNLTITIDQRREMVRTLHESKRLRQQREDYAQSQREASRG